MYLEEKRMKGIKKEIYINDKVIYYIYIEKGFSMVCFMFLGLGYNYDKLLFYYVTMFMFEYKIDVVYIYYFYDE